MISPPWNRYKHTGASREECTLGSPSTERLTRKERKTRNNTTGYSQTWNQYCWSRSGTINFSAQDNNSGHSTRDAFPWRKVKHYLFVSVMIIRKLFRRNIKRNNLYARKILAFPGKSAVFPSADVKNCYSVSKIFLYLSAVMAEWAVFCVRENFCD